MRFKEVIDTTAAPAAAFPFLSDFNNLPAWDPTIVRVEQLTAGPISVKTRLRVTLRFLGVESALDYRVEEYEPNRRPVLVGTAATVTATDTVLVEPRRGGCRVAWDADIRFAGPLRILLDFVHSPNRLKYPEVSEAGAKEWKRISWDQAFERIARHIKDDRDKNFQAKNADGVTANRFLSLGMLAASASSNETGYITHKFARSLGQLAFDNQARV